MSSEVAIVVLLTAFIHASWNAWLRGGGDRLRIRTVMVLSSSVICASMLPFLPLPSAAAWPFIGLSVTMHLAYNLLLIRMYREGDLGQTYVICRGTQPLLISLGGAIFAAEMPAGLVLVGIALVSAGIFTLAGGGLLRVSAAAVAFVTGCVSSGFTVVDGLGIRADGDVVVYASWIVALNGLPMSLLYVIVRRDLRLWHMPPRDMATAVGGGILSTVGYAMIIWAMQHGPLGPISALRETGVLFALVLGSGWLKEKFTVRKLASATMIVAGVALIYCD